MTNRKQITIAEGDGIGPEIMASTLTLLEEAGANLDIEKISIGEKLFLQGNTSGIDKSAWDSLLIIGAGNFANV